LITDRPPSYRRREEDGFEEGHVSQVHILRFGEV
jgi:hypothetical protein